MTGIFITAPGIQKSLLIFSPRLGPPATQTRRPGGIPWRAQARSTGVARRVKKFWTRVGEDGAQRSSRPGGPLAPTALAGDDCCRAVWGKSAWRENQAERRKGERTACATTTPRVRRAIQASEEKNTVLAERYGVNRKTIAKWKARESASDERMGPKNPCSSVLTRHDEAIILAYRWRTRLPLNDCQDRLRRLMPKLSRSALHRCLRRHGFSRIGKTAKCPPVTSAGLRGPYTFEITANEVVFRRDVFGVVFQVFLAVEEVTKHLYAEVIDITPKTRLRFSPIWSLNFRKRSSQSPRISVRNSPTGRRGTAKIWRRSVPMPSQSPAAPRGSSTHGQFGLIQNPLS